ncbi:MAG: ParB/RepB/Spo0J family partition protein [Halobacteriaceae archaeon]
MAARRSPADAGDVTMDVMEVSPDQLKVSDLNERKENIGTSDLEKSVREQGVIQPPIVRENGSGYEVVVGQRRTLAAQSVGLEQMPVIVMNWDDGEALEASITENIDAFREDVSKRDRALAIERLKELRDWTNVDVAEHLSVSEPTVRWWLEPLREEWEGTIIQPDVEESETVPGNEVIDIDELPDTTIRDVRSVTGGGEEGEELLKKINEHDLSKHDTEELTRKIRKGRDIDEALAQTIEEKHSTGDIKVSANVSFTGDRAGAITKVAKDRGMTENEVVREAIEYFLETEGYI